MSHFASIRAGSSRLAILDFEYLRSGIRIARNGMVKFVLLLQIESHDENVASSLSLQLTLDLL